MKKWIILFAGFALFGIFPVKAIAQMGMPALSTVEGTGNLPQDISDTNETNDEHGENIDQVMAALLQKHDAATVNDLSCDRLEESDFEKLGEAWMGVMHPDLEVHKRMDQMMGGEGSETLRQAHISMGQRYLGCSGSFGMTDGMGMMGMGGMMSTIRGGSTNMMNWGGTGMMGTPFFTGFIGLLWFATWILVVVLLVVIIRYFLKKTEDI
jgi:hypothetical protein